MSYRDALAKTIEYWNLDPIEDEWFFEKFRSEYIGRMDASEAFLAINETVDFLISEDDESTACEILQTIINLAEKSQTTEIPSELVKQVGTIESKFISRGEYSKAKLDELFRYYRLS